MVYIRNRIDADIKFLVYGTALSIYVHVHVIECIRNFRMCRFALRMEMSHTRTEYITPIGRRGQSISDGFLLRRRYCTISRIHKTVGADDVGTDVGIGIGASVSQPHVAKQLSYAYVPSDPSIEHRLAVFSSTQAQCFHVFDLYHVVLSWQEPCVGTSVMVGTDVVGTCVGWGVGSSVRWNVGVDVMGSRHVKPLRPHEDLMPFATHVSSQQSPPSQSHSKELADESQNPSPIQ
mmetsp:Transcript_27553/g.37773  ORF Transcript_27553/g.37773 Transcript_27553/m.37773 type:complete len:234 (-) Transcript_27553:646-1347(-)